MDDSSALSLTIILSLPLLIIAGAAAHKSLYQEAVDAFFGEDPHSTY